jgi:hypothetical protein
LKQFEQWLRHRALSDKTVQTHGDNVAFYLKDFLLFGEPQKPEDGVDQIGRFLGDGFVRLNVVLVIYLQIFSGAVIWKS